MAKPRYEKVKPGALVYEKVAPGTLSFETGVPIERLGEMAAPREPSTFEQALPMALAGNAPRVLNVEPGQELTEAQQRKLLAYQSQAKAGQREELHRAAGGGLPSITSSAVSGLPVVRGIAPLLSAAADAATSGRTFAESRDLMRGQYGAARQDSPVAGILPMLTPLGPLTSTPLRVAGTFGLDALLANAGGRVLEAPERTIGGAFTPTSEGLVSALRDAAASAATAGLGAKIGGSLIGGAPERVAGRVAQDVTRGETSAALRLGKKVSAAVGPEGTLLNEVVREIDRANTPATRWERLKATFTPSLEHKLSTQSRTDPAVTGKAVQKPIAVADAAATAEYDLMDKAGVYYQTKRATRRLSDLARQLGTDGRMEAATAVDTAATAYGSGRLGDKLTASALRNLKGELGKVAFAKAPGEAVSVSIAARRMVYGELDKMIDELATLPASKRAGVNVGEIAKANKIMRTLIPIRDALAERATKEAIGTPALTHTINRATSMAAFLENPTLLRGAGVLAMAPPKAVTRIGRELDYGLASLVKAARNGSKPAQITTKAIELGISPAIAAEISRNLTKAAGEAIGESAAPEAP